MTTLNLSIENLEESAAPLYSQYDGQCQPQPAYVYLNPRTGEVTADWSGEIGNSMSMDVWNKLDLRWSVQSNILGHALQSYLEDDDFKKLAQIIIDGFEEEWDGSNYVGTYTEEAEESVETIGHDLEKIEVANVYDASDWLDCSLSHDADDYCQVDATKFEIDGIDTVITAETTDKQLDEIHSELLLCIDSDQQVEGLEEYLAELREICQENAE